MLILPIHCPILHAGDRLSSLLLRHGEIRANDLLVISSKAVATVEGTAIDLKTTKPTREAEQWSKKCGKTPEFRQAVLDETERMRGLIIGSCPQAMLTELRPDGLTEGTILAINAGLDESNIKEGYAIGWPRDPVKSVQNLREELEKQISGQSDHLPLITDHSSKTSKMLPKIGVILSDSCCRPRRIGVTAMALTVSGIDPLTTMIGKQDLFGKELRMTIEATADQLATAANFLMGNAAQSIPAVIIRDHGLPFIKFTGWIPGIATKEDIFRGMFS